MKTVRIIAAIICGALTALFLFTTLTTTDMTAGVTSLVLTVLLATATYFVFPREPKDKTGATPSV